MVNIVKEVRSSLMEVEFIIIVWFVVHFAYLLTMFELFSLHHDVEIEERKTCRRGLDEHN